MSWNSAYEFATKALLATLGLITPDSQAQVPDPYKAPESASAKIARVIDGDTVLVVSSTWPAMYVSVRVRDIDTPEKDDRAKCDKERALGDEATAYAKEVMHVGDFVTLRRIKPDKYPSRIDADVHLTSGDSYGELVMSVKLAKAWPAHKPKPDWCR